MWEGAQKLNTETSISIFMDTAPWLALTGLQLGSICVKSFIQMAAEPSYRTRHFARGQTHLSPMIFYRLRV